ncbi:unnamed protein product, partial [Owenia fusiformis]
GMLQQSGFQSSSQWSKGKRVLQHLGNFWIRFGIISKCSLNQFISLLQSLAILNHALYQISMLPFHQFGWCGNICHFENFGKKLKNLKQNSHPKTLTPANCHFTKSLFKQENYLEKRNFGLNMVPTTLVTIATISQEPIKIEVPNFIV